MQVQGPLQSLSNQVTSTLLKKGSKDTSNVRALQMLLYGLGYGKQLHWTTYKADGGYGGGTTSALASFKNSNGLGNDGAKLDGEALKSLLAAYALLPVLRGIYNTEDDEGIQTLFNSDGYADKADALSKASGVAFASAVPNYEEAKAAFDKLRPKYGKGFMSSLYEGEAGAKPRITSESKGYVISDDWVNMKLNKHKKGVWTMGDETPKRFITGNEVLLLDSGLSESDVRVITPVSANEGNLNAINTWDNCFMTFGMFQWTLGQRGAKGELPALLQRIQNEEPEAFEEYFGRYGISLVDTNKTLGYLALDGSKIDTVAEKEKFRKGPDWAFRFWKAGLDNRVKKVQVGHAVDRLSSFLRNDNYRPLDKFYIGDLITSEYGLCLLLDHHVNRPGHLMSYSIGKKDIIGQALKKAGLENSEPSTWGTEEEQKLIKAYLPLRYASSMTHGKDRAAKIKGYLDRGSLSDERSSYQAAPQLAASRSLDALEPYSIINHEEYENRESRE